MDIAQVTVIVPTKNEEKNVIPFLDSLHPEVELIVVDSNADGTPDVVEANRPEHTLVLHREAKIAEARQMGAKAAETEWLLYLNLIPEERKGRDWGYWSGGT